MRTPNIAAPGPELTEVQVREFELELGYALPETYREFLLAWNGGSPTPAHMRTPSFPGSSATHVRVLYGLGRVSSAEDLRWCRRLWIQDCPKTLLSIGDDDGGSEFCLSLQGPDIGQVYYWDYYREIHPVETRYPWTYWVASSFDEFLNKLTILED